MSTEKSTRDATDAVVVALLVVTSMMAAGVAVVGATSGQESGVTDGTNHLGTAESVESAARQNGPLSGEINLSNADTEIHGEAENDTAGWSLTELGDVNGDGRDDVLVGVPRNDTAGNDSGAAFLFYGPVERGDVALSEADATFTGVAPRDWAGYSVGGGDVNGDGRADVVVGAPLNDSPGENAGAAYVFYGGESLAGTHSLADANATFVGEGADDKAGWSVDVAANATASGAGAVLVGAPSQDSAGPEAGAAYAVSGEGTPTGTASLSNATTKLTGENASDRAGWSLSSAEDVDGDGLADLVVGARDANATAPNSGAAYVVSDVLGVGESDEDGSVSLASADARLTGVGAYDLAGFSVSSAGDVNDDGYADVIVGAPYNDSTAKDAGAAYVVYGAETLSNRSLADADLVLRGEAAGDRAGWSVSSAGSGDVTCDDYADVLVGAPFHNASAGPSAGAAYLVAGGEGRHVVDLADADAKLVGEAARDRAGYEVSDAGDVNADGTNDVLVGAPFNDDGAKNAGAAYVVHGACPEEPKTTDRGDVDTATTTTETTTEKPKTTTTTEKTTKTTEKTTKETPTETTTETTTEKPKTTTTTEKTTEKPETATTTEKTTETTTTETTTTETTETTTDTTTQTTTTTEETTAETTETTTTTEKTTTTETTTTETTTERDDRAAISYVAFCVEGEKGPGNDPCPDGERQLVKFEWSGNQFAPEGGDSEGVVIQATAFKDGDPSEPVAATWTSVEAISTVVVKSGPETCEYPGGNAGTIESCGPPPGQESRSGLPGAPALIGGAFAATVLASRRGT